MASCYISDYKWKFRVVDPEKRIFKIDGKECFLIDEGKYKIAAHSIYQLGLYYFVLNTDYRRTQYAEILSIHLEWYSREMMKSMQVYSKLRTVTPVVMLMKRVDNESIR